MRAKQEGKFIWEFDRTLQAKRANIKKNWHFSTNSRKVKIRLFIFFPEETYLFSAFSRSEYLFPKSASPPPVSNGHPVTSIKNVLKENTTVWSKEEISMHAYCDLDNESWLRVKVKVYCIDKKDICAEYQSSTVIFHDAMKIPWHKIFMQFCPDFEHRTVTMFQGHENLSCQKKLLCHAWTCHYDQCYKNTTQ